jgi:hypothetical protein
MQYLRGSTLTDDGRGGAILPRPIPNSYPYPMSFPIHKPQEIPFDSPASCCFFQPTLTKPFVATPAALNEFGNAIFTCLWMLQAKARKFNGLDYLQVFEFPGRTEPLWFIEDGDGGAITALLPADY